MSHGTWHRRAALVALPAVTLVVAGLIVSGLQAIPVRTSSAQVPVVDEAALLRPGETACEGPVLSPSRASLIGIWGQSFLGISRVRVDVRDAVTHRSLSTGTAAASAGNRLRYVSLNRAVPADRRVRICLTSVLATFQVFGSSTAQGPIRATGSVRNRKFALLLARRGTFLGSLGTAFRRAAVFRPRWMGEWTFWILVGLFATTLALGAVAVRSASSDDEQSERSREAEDFVRRSPTS